MSRSYQVSELFVETLKIFWHRPPIDSAIRHGDFSGLYDNCVTIMLSSGQVVEQNIYPGITHCHPVFIKEWSRLLYFRWKMVYYLRFFEYLFTQLHFTSRKLKSNVAVRIFAMMRNRSCPWMLQNGLFGLNIWLYLVLS